MHIGYSISLDTCRLCLSIQGWQMEYGYSSHKKTSYAVTSTAFHLFRLIYWYSNMPCSDIVRLIINKFWTVSFIFIFVLKQRLLQLVNFPSSSDWWKKKRMLQRDISLHSFISPSCFVGFDSPRSNSNWVISWYSNIINHSSK